MKGEMEGGGAEVDRVIDSHALLSLAEDRAWNSRRRSCRFAVWLVMLRTPMFDGLQDA